jgi:hypothetical protein
MTSSQQALVGSTPSTLSSPIGLSQNLLSDVDCVSETSASSSGRSDRSGIPKSFAIPDTWRAEIMTCIRKKSITPKARNALVRDLVVHMYTYGSRPSRNFCEFTSRRLIMKYPFLRDAVGTGYVSTMHTCVIFLFVYYIVIYYRSHSTVAEVVHSTYVLCCCIPTIGSMEGLQN